MVSNILVLRGAAAPSFDLPGVEFTAMAAPSRGSRELCTWRISVAPGLESVPHTLDRDEVFMVTAGSLRLHPDAETLHPGDTAVVPAGSPVQLSNPGADAAAAYVVVAAGFAAADGDGTPLPTPPWAQ